MKISIMLKKSLRRAKLRFTCSSNSYFFRLLDRKCKIRRLGREIRYMENCGKYDNKDPLLNIARKQQQLLEEE